MTAGPDLPPEIDAVIARAIAISPEDRYPSCAEFIAAASVLLPEGRVAEAAIPTVPSAMAGDPRASRVMSMRTPPGSESTLVPLEAIRLIARAGVAMGRELLVEDELGSAGSRSMVRSPTIWRSHGGMPRCGGRQQAACCGGPVLEERHVREWNAHRGPASVEFGDEFRIGSTVFEVAEVKRQPVGSPGASSRVVVRLELDLDAGELSVRIEDGPSARIVRGADGWRVEST